jgi:hypothetical protein
MAEQGRLPAKSDVYGISEAFDMARYRNVLLCGLVILIVLVPLWPAFEKSAAPMDEGSLLVYPELVLKGQLPYRDFETFYGPANLWVLSGVYAVFSPGIFVERAAGLFYRVLILGAIFAIARRWNGCLAAGCTIVAGILLLPSFLAAYAWMGGIMCALWSIWLIAKPESNRRVLIGGILAGAALLFRPDLGPAVFVSALPLLLLARFTGTRNYVCGFAIALLPLLWIALAASPTEVVNNLFVYPVIYSRPGRHLEIFSADSYVVSLFLLHVAAAITNTVVGAIAIYVKRKDPTARLLLSVGLFGLALTHQAAQRIDFLHVIFAALVSIGTLPLAIFALFQLRPGLAISANRDGTLATSLVLVLLGLLVPEFTGYARHEAIAAFHHDKIDASFVQQGDRCFPVNTDQQAISFRKVLNTLDSKAQSGDRLFVGPADLRRTNRNDTFIYHLMPRLRPATYFLEMNPGSANRANSRLANDVASADWLVLDHALDTVTEKNESVRFASDLPMQIVAGRFELCAQYGPLDLYRKKNPAAL